MVLWVHGQVSNHEELRQYAARQTIEALKRGANHDSMVALAAAIVGASPATKKHIPRKAVERLRTNPTPKITLTLNPCLKRNLTERKCGDRRFSDQEQER